MIIMGQKTTSIICIVQYLVLLCSLSLPTGVYSATVNDYQATPPFITEGTAPLLMLVLGRNHKLYYEAYNDASDLDGDGVLDVGYNPTIDYYGYFDSYKYYEYTGSRYEPVGKTDDKRTPSGNYWSGDFLNYLSMTRMDCLRKVLYGGYRSTDTATETVLERVFVPQDAHSWGKEYNSQEHDGYDITDYTPLAMPAPGTRHLFVSTTLGSSEPPILRVLENSIYRIWEWVAIERPVGGDQANKGNGRRSVTDNQVSSNGMTDLTYAGVAGTMDSNGDGSDGDPGGIFEDDFSTAKSEWNWVDKSEGDGSYQRVSDSYLQITSRGADVWWWSDYYAARYLDNLVGDFDFSVRVLDQTNSDGWAKCGIMLRNDIAVASGSYSDGYSFVAATPEYGAAVQYDSDGDGLIDGSVNEYFAEDHPDRWLRLVKEGTLLYAYHGSNGSDWDLILQGNIEENLQTQDVGLFVTSHNSSVASSCQFDQVVITAPVPHPEYAFDDSATTAWTATEEPDADSDTWLEFAFTDAQEIQTYTVSGGDDAPLSWVLQGSNNQTDWVELDSVSDGGLTDGAEVSFEVASPGEYLYYRLYITSTTDAGTEGFQVYEVQLFDGNVIPDEATLTDYEVKVVVADPAAGLESNIKEYPGNGTTSSYKPVGILQKHGESENMYFGLISGSYQKNTSGGVLRQNIHSIKEEINSVTGEFRYLDDSSVGGIVKTIDSLKLVGFSYPDDGYYYYSENCDWITTRSVVEGECRMWGNPIGEMMYESLRYFAGKKSPTSQYTYGADTTYDDNVLGLPKPDWEDPYDSEDGYDYCAKPFMLVLSDIYPTYDSDQLPGSKWESVVTDELSGLNVQKEAEKISSYEGISLADPSVSFIGQAGSDADSSCSPKKVDNYADIRGLCPEEPTKQGSYYGAAVSYFGNMNDLHSADDGQKVATYAVGLASPLPEIKIAVGGSFITLVPFGKSTGGSSISADKDDFQPTDTIVDFFVEEITDTYGKFRVNFEDVEQGADHDMDAVVKYTYQVLDASGNAVTSHEDGTQVKISLDSTYAAGSIIQHMGYIISGTTQDGTYLEVRDADTSIDDSPAYYLDTPPGCLPGDRENGSSECQTEKLPLVTSRTFTPGTDEAAGLMKNPLWYAAKYGGFEDYDNDGYPSAENEWDSDSDGDPDTYFYVQNPLQLEAELNSSFADILRRAASGTAASVVSQSRTGEGAVYQAIFYPELVGEQGNTATWVGSVQALFVDSNGNLREDTNGNAALDISEDSDGDSVLDNGEDTNGNGVLDAESDYIIRFDGSAIAKYEDLDGNNELEDSETTPVFNGELEDIKFLWTSTAWLNDISDTNVVSQRVYGENTENRYILTFVDSDGDMVADSGEVMDFATPASISYSNVSDKTSFISHLTLFDSFEDEPTVAFNSTERTISSLRSCTDGCNFEWYLTEQAERQINFIRGEDQDQVVENLYVLPAFRSRSIDYEDDAVVNSKTWRLGDVIHSTPTVVGTPADAYHLLYGDESYADFYAKYQQRRKVVYVGANDGMMHAFNGGFYDSDEMGYTLKSTDCTAGSDCETEYPLGAELWAYVPYNLLPHLYWLSEESYPHVYYVDMKPKIFDAKILPDGTHTADEDKDGEPDWGTFLLGGMRLGGGLIYADLDKTSGSIVIAEDKEMRSAYFLLDITDPEQPPTVIAEFTFPELGFTTSYPAIAPIKATVSADDENGWYLIFGSGPASISGEPLGDVIGDVVSEQKGKIFVLDLLGLANDGILRILPEGATEFQQYVADATDGTYPLSYFSEIERESFITNPITVDYDLDYAADVSYYGTVGYDLTEGVWNGSLERLIFADSNDPADWLTNKPLMELLPDIDGNGGQPVSAHPTVGLDDHSQRWVYFGTGRYFVTEDGTITDQQSYYGVVEPYDDTDSDGYFDSGESLTWNSVDKDNLIDVSYSEVYDDLDVEGVNDRSGNDIPNWYTLVDDTSEFGWFRDFHEASGERNLGQATLFGEMLTFTTYAPTNDICVAEGVSYLYSLYYKTGTAHYTDVIGYDYVERDGEAGEGSGDRRNRDVISLGDGLAMSPNIHTGSGEDAKIFIQDSTGGIQVIEQDPPGIIKSGLQGWKEER